MATTPTPSVRPFKSTAAAGRVPHSPPGATSAASLLNIGAVTGSAMSAGITTLTLNGANTGANAIAGVIGDGISGGSLAVVMNGTGQWQLTGANTYSGGTTISSGVLEFANPTAMPSAGRRERRRQRDPGGRCGRCGSIQQRHVGARFHRRPRGRHRRPGAAVNWSAGQRAALTPPVEM